MPLLTSWHISPTARAAIWIADEPESFFAGHTGITSTIPSDKRRIEHLAGRFLLRYLDAGFPLHAIAKDEYGKPRVPGNSRFFSISHSWPYIAVVIDTEHEAGIDIQTFNPRIERIKHKFISAEEQEMLLHDVVNFTLAWCAKEAAFKWQGIREVGFITALPIYAFHKNKNIDIFLKLKVPQQLIRMETMLTADFACAYAVIKL